MMQPDLQTFLASLQPTTTEVVRWDTLELRVYSYLTTLKPPIALITSVRAIVLRANEILTVRDPTSVHIMPGGRCESGETWEQTVSREVIEETGWALDNLDYIGFNHYHHLTPRPADYPYPYPDFLQVIYHANATIYQPEARESNGYELESDFYPLAQRESLRLKPNEFAFLNFILTTR
jgi:ADP-ribose pyrophosphatase YjhB (NUDIX family)